jgi:hypothetical protein
VLVLSLQQIVDDAFEAMATFPASLLRAPTCMYNCWKDLTTLTNCNNNKYLWNFLADAVAFEPVSTLKFPANREKNREFHQIRPLDAILKADPRANSAACGEIP